MKLYRQLKNSARRNMEKNPLGFAIGAAAVLWGAVCPIVRILV
jgi:hypothetical protein